MDKRLYTRIHGRLCCLREIDKATADGFLSESHRLGTARAKYRYGLFYKENLVAVALFSKLRVWPREEGAYRSAEWVRYASLPQTRVVGGMGKFLQHFIQTVHPDDVMSYADSEWSQGAAYLKLGFEKVAEQPPQAFWWDPVGQKRYPLKRYPTGKPGWEKVYSGGNLKFVYRVWGSPGK